MLFFFRDHDILHVGWNLAVMDAVNMSHYPALIQYWGCVLVGILLCLLIVAPAKADVGVQPILPDGSNIQSKEETPIQMSAEKVVFNVRQATEWDRAAIQFNRNAYELLNPTIPIWSQSVAEVTAVFTMTNPTNEAVSMTAWFPLASALESDEWENHIGEVPPRIEDFQISVDRKPLDYSVSELPNPKGNDKPALPWASFPISFPAGEDTHILVNYNVWAQPDIVGVSNYLSYIFQTGAGWAGLIGKAELVVNLPYPASAETIVVMPEGGQVEGHQVRWTWANLEPGPQDDFSIGLIRQDRWEELEAARIRVMNWSEDGEAWLDLADTYRRLILGKYSIIQGFGVAYRPLGIQAAQQALLFLGDNAKAHYELAIFYLSALPENPSPAELQPLLDELRVVVALDPSYEGDIRDWMEFLLSEDTWNSLKADWVAETVEADSSTVPAQEIILTSTPVPAATPEVVALSTEVEILEKEGKGQSTVLFVTAGMIGLIVVVFVFWKILIMQTKK